MVTDNVQSGSSRKARRGNGFSRCKGAAGSTSPASRRRAGSRISECFATSDPAPLLGGVGDATPRASGADPSTPLGRQRLQGTGAGGSPWRPWSHPTELGRGEKRGRQSLATLALRLVREGVVPGRPPDSPATTAWSVTFNPRSRPPRSRSGRRSPSPAATSPLCINGLTCTVSFGTPERRSSAARYALAAMVDATCIYFSRAGEPVSEIFRRARRIYEKFKNPHEWTLDYQGFVIGYAAREVLLMPESRMVLGAGTAVCWSPSAERSRRSSGPSGRRRRGGFELVTGGQNWPDPRNRGSRDCHPPPRRPRTLGAQNVMPRTGLPSS